MEVLTIIGWVLTGISLIGVILNAYKRIEGFYLMLPSSIGWVIYNYYLDLYSQALLFFVYIFLNILGLYQWSKMAKEEKAMKKSLRVVEGEDAKRLFERMERANSGESYISKEKYDKMIKDAKELGLKL